MNVVCSVVKQVSNIENNNVVLLRGSAPQYLSLNSIGLCSFIFLVIENKHSADVVIDTGVTYYVGGHSADPWITNFSNVPF